RPRRGLHRPRPPALRAVPLRSPRGQHSAPAGRAARLGRAGADLLGPPADAGAMRREAIAWERAAEVHAAARGWRRAGAIDEVTHERIREAFPDPCVTPGPVWRALTGG